MTVSPAGLHHGYTRKELQEFGRKNDKARFDTLKSVESRRQLVFDHIKHIQDGCSTRINFRYYFVWKKSYREWLKLAAFDRKLGRNVLPLP